MPVLAPGAGPSKPGEREAASRILASHHPNTGDCQHGLFVSIIR